MSGDSKKSVRSRLMSQFARPSGTLGRLAGLILANRPSNVKRNRWTVEQLALSPADRVLEVGCGPGVALKFCLTASPTISVVGLDHSDVMIAMARARNRTDAMSGRLHLVAGDLSALAFVGKGFTKVMMINVAQFVPDMKAMFSDLRSRIDNRGMIAVTHEPRNPGATRKDGEAFAGEIRDALDQAGFGNIRTELLPLKPMPAWCIIGEAAQP